MRKATAHHDHHQTQGGLGNQLFQYALGRAIAERSGRELKLDVSSYASDALRAFPSPAPFDPRAVYPPAGSKR